MLKPLSKSLTEVQGVLTFEYTAKSAVSFIQVFMGSPITEERSLKTSNGLTTSSGWIVWSQDLTDERIKFEWGATGDLLRLDFGDVEGVEITIRNICFRERNEDERLAAAKKE